MTKDLKERLIELVRNSMYYTDVGPGGSGYRLCRGCESLIDEQHKHDCPN